MSAREMEVEAAIFWRASRNLSALRVVPVLTPALLELSNETFSDLEVMAMHSDWPMIRIRAQKALDRALTAQASQATG